MRQFSNLEQRLLNEFQHGIPLTPEPYADIARELGVYQTTILETLERLLAEDRLPDEIEWECACRAGTQGTFCWSGGVEVGHQYANISDTTSYLGVLGVKEIWPRDDGHGVAAPVGSYLPNTYGLYDMIGNVSEFTTGTNKTNPDGSLLPPNPQYMRVPITRGGSWLLGVQQARCAARNPAGAVVVLGFPDHGFRLVADLEPIEGDW